MGFVPSFLFTGKYWLQAKPREETLKYDDFHFFLCAFIECTNSLAFPSSTGPPSLPRLCPRLHGTLPKVGCEGAQVGDQTTGYDDLGAAPAGLNRLGGCILSPNKPLYSNAHVFTTSIYLGQNWSFFSDLQWPNRQLFYHFGSSSKPKLFTSAWASPHHPWGSRSRP